MYVLKVKPALSAGFDFTVAIATVHRFVTAGFKGHLSILTALGAFCREHLPLGSVARATVSVTFCFPCLAARGTALGLVSIASRLELFLFLSAKGKSIAAIGTFEGLILKTH